MHVHALARNVTSKTQVRSSSSSSKLNHSWAVGGDGGVRPAMTGMGLLLATAERLAADPAQLDQQLTRGQQPFPELAHHHALVRGVIPIVGEGDAEVQNGRLEHATQ